MMKRSWVISIVIVFSLLSIGWFTFRWMNPASLAEEDSFQYWLWNYRSLDIITQVLLIFAGALGIAAILPGEEDDA